MNTKFCHKSGKDAPRIMEDSKGFQETGQDRLGWSEGKSSDSTPVGTEAGRVHHVTPLWQGGKL